MDITEFTEEVGCWKKEKVLGAGGFGYVVLWRNKETNETIALKQCRWGSHDILMTPKHRSRWKLEVDMMSRLDHPNVVRAIAVPPELDVPVTELPLLAMEYCSSGDLRKMLNKPENCCGLDEKNVRLLLRHVSSAVNYLHSMKIIHRDLKPENIVIQDIDNKVLFKLIDLGYAKELDQGSLCTSFVGTLQYLAPELFLTQKYSCTVDYWSLGLVTHEVISGQRPFLPDKAPPEWIPIIKKKKSTHIRAYLDSDKKVVFSNEFSPWHNICSVLRYEIEQWLQLMLEWDPKKRGKGEKMNAFSFLEKVLNRKVVLVFDTESCKLLSFFADEQFTLDQLQREIEQKTGIPIRKQDLINSKGHSLDVLKGIFQCAANLEEEELITFLFHKHPSSLIPPIPNVTIPSSVETMMRNPRVTVKYLEQRESWTQAVFLSRQESTLFSRLVQSFRSNLMNLLTKTSSVHKRAVQMTGEMSKLLAKSSFFQKSLEQDLHSYMEQARNGGFSSNLMYEGWRSSLDNMKDIEILKEKVINLEAFSMNISTQTIDLQRSSYARSKQNDPLEDVYHKVLDIYDQLRKRPKEQRHVPHDNTDMVRLMCLCLQHRVTQIRDILLFIRKVTHIKREIDELCPQLEVLVNEIADWDKQVHIWQNKRQEEMWRLVESLTKKVQQALLPSTPSMMAKQVEHPSFGHCSSPPYAFWSQMSPYGSPDICRSSSSSSNDINYYQLSGSNCHQMQLSSSRKFTPPLTSVCIFQNEGLANITHNPSLTKRHSSSAQLKASTPAIPSSSISVQHDIRDTDSTSPHSASIGAISLASLLEKTAESSQKIKQENKVLIQSFQSMMEYMKNEQDSTSEMRMDDLKSVLPDHKS